MSTASTEYYCSLASQAMEEEIFATASHCQFFVLVGHKGPFPYSPQKAYLQNTSWYLQLIKEVKLRKGKLLLIRTDEPVIYYIDHFNSRYFTVNYDDDFNTNSLWNQIDVNWQYKLLFLVCTNGKRDKCCSLRGMPAFKEFKKSNRHNVFQCSHVGGDRFAANVLLMPAGIYYGRVTEADTPYIIQAAENDAIVLNNFRGRAIYNLVHQAADYFLRKEFKISTINTETEWLHFQNQDGYFNIHAILNKMKIVMALERIPSKTQARLTCNALKAEAHYEFKLLQMKIEN